MHNLRSKISGTPLVSICIPVFNSSALVGRALISLLNQTYKNIEIIVSDNVSTDNTREVVEQYAKKDSRVRYFRNDSNVGFNGSLLLGYQRARGEFVQLVGDDDWLSKNYIEEGINSFKVNPDAAAVFPKTVDCKLTDDGKFFLKRELAFRSGIYSKDYFLKNIHRNAIGSMSITSLLRRKDALRATEYILGLFKSGSDVKYGQLCETAIDMRILLNIIKDYDYFVFNSLAAYIKVDHKANAGKYYSTLFSKKTFSGSIGYYDFFYHCIYPEYASSFKGYLSFLRTSLALEAINTAIFNFIKARLNPSFFKDIAPIHQMYFNYLTRMEKLSVILRWPFNFLLRIISLILRPYYERRPPYRSEYYFNENGEFKTI